MLANSTLPLYLQVSIAFVHPLVALIGIAGNVLILTIVPRASVGVSRSAKLYYSVIAVADFFQLLLGTFIWGFLEDGLLLLTENRFSLRIARYSDATCKLFYLLNELSESLSNYTIVALALERCLIIFFPLRAKRFVRRRFSVMLIAIIVAPAWLCAFVSVPIIVELDKDMQHSSQSGCECEKNQEHSLTATFTVALTVFSYTLHTILNIILVTMISIKLAHIRYKRKSMIRNNLMHFSHRIATSVAQHTRNNCRGSPVAARRRYSIETRKQNHDNNRHSFSVIEASNKMELLPLKSDRTNTSESSSTNPRLRFQSSPSASRSPLLSGGIRSAQSQNKRISKDISSDPQKEDSLKNIENLCETQKKSMSQFNSSDAKFSQISTVDKFSGIPQQHRASTGLSAACLDSVPEYSEMSCSSSIPKPHSSPRLASKSLDITEKPDPESLTVLREGATKKPLSPSSSPRLSRAPQLTKDIKIMQTTTITQSAEAIPSRQETPQPPHEQLTATSNSVEETAALRRLSPSRRNKQLSCRSVDRCAENEHVTRSSSIRQEGRPQSGCVGGSGTPSRGSDGGVGIGATVVMVLLAAINVAIYLPAAVVELTLLLLDEKQLEPNTYSILESLSRFLFDNLCFAHALNFFVYVARYYLYTSTALGENSYAVTNALAILFGTFKLIYRRLGLK